MPNGLRKEVLAKLSELEQRTHSISSLGGHLKVLASHAGSSDPRERRFVAKHYRTTTKHLSNDNHLTFMKNIQPALEAWLKEGDGAVFETAVGIRREQSVPGHYGLGRLPARSLWPLFYA
ncbi:hypothetical protein WMF39_26370 [Sorangium sp. So ce1504]|uniref:hypothetical protein n=1 Tax=Sorangium sp. So ce1504 TaxID=3133337 RepID=UPI003F61C9C5